MITLWKALIIFYIYFCSQLWALHRQSHIVQLEGLQRTFPFSTRKHKDHTGATEKHDYWKRLTEHELHSERRIKRHQVIYKRKVLEGQSTPPKTGPIPPINASNDARTGKKYVQYYLSSKCQALKKGGLADPSTTSLNSWETLQGWRQRCSKENLTNFWHQSRVNQKQCHTGIYCNMSAGNLKFNHFPAEFIFHWGRHALWSKRGIYLILFTSQCVPVSP